MCVLHWREQITNRNSSLVSLTCFIQHEYINFHILEGRLDGHKNLVFLSWPFWVTLMAWCTFNPHEFFDILVQRFSCTHSGKLNLRLFTPLCRTKFLLPVFCIVDVYEFQYFNTHASPNLAASWSILISYSIVFIKHFWFLWLFSVLYIVKAIWQIFSIAIFLDMYYKL